MVGSSIPICYEFKYCHKAEYLSNGWLIVQVISMKHSLWVMLMKSLNGWSNVLMSAWRKRYLLVCVG
jgi:hypothetical protein